MGIILDTSILIEYEKGRLDIGEFTSGRENDIFGISVISVSELLHGVHRADLLQNGMKIGAHDLMIGATALSKDFSVATFNKRHFEKIKGLKLELIK